jgi:hypothetical protein
MLWNADREKGETYRLPTEHTWIHLGSYRLGVQTENLHLPLASLNESASITASIGLLMVSQVITGVTMHMVSFQEFVNTETGSTSLVNSRISRV